jgi:hypothetical protein
MALERKGPGNPVAPFLSFPFQFQEQQQPSKKNTLNHFNYVETKDHQLI